MLPRIHAQWLPTPDLSDDRFLSLGPRWSSPVQQDGIEWTDSAYPQAFVLSRLEPDGCRRMQVGFAAPTHYTELGWTFAGSKVAQDGEFRRFSEQPTPAELVERQECYLRDAGRLPTNYAERVKTVRKRVEQLRAERDASAARQAAEYMAQQEALASGAHAAELAQRLPVGAGRSQAHEEAPSETIAPERALESPPAGSC